MSARSDTSERPDRQDIDHDRIAAVIKAAERMGLLRGKSARVGGRISPALLAQAKKRTGIEADTDLLEFALANVALADEFPSTFKSLKGTVDPSLNLEF